MEPLTRVDEAHIRELLDEGTYVWVDLAKPDREAIAALGRALPIHPLALEDSTEQGQWPKVKRYQDSALIVFYGAQGGPGGVAAPSRCTCTWGRGSSVASARSGLGILLDGVLTEWLSWRWSLYVTLVTAVPVALASADRAIDDARTRRRCQLGATIDPGCRSCETVGA